MRGVRYLLESAQNISWYVSPAHAELWVVAWSLRLCRHFLFGSFASDLCSAWPPSTVHESCSSRHFHHASTYAMATDTNKTQQTARAPVCLAVTLFSATKALTFTGKSRPRPQWRQWMETCRGCLALKPFC